MKPVQTVLSQHSDSLTRGRKEDWNCPGCQIIVFSKRSKMKQSQLSKGSADKSFLYFMVTSIAQAWRKPLRQNVLRYSALQGLERKHTQYSQNLVEHWLSVVLKAIATISSMMSVTLLWGKEHYSFFPQELNMKLLFW